MQSNRNVGEHKLEMIAGVLLLSLTAVLVATSARTAPVAALTGSTGPTPAASYGPEFAPGTYRWNKAAVTYRLANCPRALDCAAAHGAVRTAMAQWDAVIALSLDEVTEGGDIVITWVSGNDGGPTTFDGRGRVTAYSIIPVSGGANPLDGDIYFDNDENWVAGPTARPFPKEAHLQTIAVHEIGHALGLPHSGDPASTMYPIYTNVRGLTQDSVLAVQGIYGAQ